MSKFVPDDETFDKYTIIDREPFADHLTEFLNSNKETGYVLNLNAEWGAGKTTFLHCWYNKLKENHPVIYFNAWETDFSNDPMLALVDTFQMQLANAINDNKGTITSLINGTSHFLRAGLPAAVAGAIKHKVGMEGDDSFFEDVTDTLGFEIGKDAMSDSVKDTLKAMLEQRKKVEGIQKFKSILEELGEQYLEIHTNKEGPIYVLIDELDRCRPNYSIEIIESVKHFFNTKNFVFILATDTDQLQHSIKAIYGNGFDSMSYLSRFFDNSVTLSAPDRIHYIESKLPTLSSDQDVHYLAIKFIDAMFDWHNITSLREIGKIFDCVEIALSKSKSFKIYPLILLAILKRRFPNQLKKYINSNRPPYTPTYGIRNNNSDSEGLVQGVISLQFDITTQSKTLIDYMLYSILKFIDHTEVEQFSSFKVRQVPSQEMNRVIQIFGSSALINEGELIAARDDYLAIINFAGHFN